MTNTPGGEDWDAAFDTVTTNGANTSGRTDPTSRPAPAPGSDDSPAPTPMFDTLEGWVSGWLAPIITVEVGAGMRWCAQWWQHPMAIARLESMWREWEKARLADEMSVWWRDHADPHLDQLMEAPRSPFRQCNGSPDGHREDLRPLPVEPAPPGWFG